MSRFIHPLRLREEARKSWDYIIFNEIVYVGEEVKRDVFHGVGGYAKGYIENELYLEIECDLGRNMYMTAIIDAAKGDGNVGRSGEVRTKTGEDGCDRPMLIKPTNIEEYSQQIGFRPILSVVRLKTFNDVTGSLRDSFKATYPRPSVFLRVRKDGEEGKNVVRIESQIPDQMVKTGHQVIGDVTHDAAQSKGGRLVDFSPKGAARLFRIFILYDRIWMECKEGCDLLIKGVTMFLRPLNLEPSAFQRFHGLYSAREQGAKTQKTPKGHEIPVPTRDDVMRVFKKAAKPDSEKESRGRRPKE